MLCLVVVIAGRRIYKKDQRDLEPEMELHDHRTSLAAPEKIISLCRGQTKVSTNYYNHYRQCTRIWYACTRISSTPIVMLHFGLSSTSACSRWGDWARRQQGHAAAQVGLASAHQDQAAGDHVPSDQGHLACAPPSVGFLLAMCPRKCS